MALQPKDQWKVLQTPLIVTAVILAAILAGAWVMHRLRPSKEPPIAEAPAPPASLRNLTFFKEEGDYVLYFSLCDAAGKEIARTGDATLRVSQLGTLGMEGGPQFVNEMVLLDASFQVGLPSYRWIEIGGGWFFTQHQLIVPKRITPDLFKRRPPSGALGKISVRFRDAKVASAELYLEKKLLFP